MDFLVWIIIGLLLGVFCGLVPGLHPNLLGALLITSFLQPNLFFVLIPMLITFRFFDFLRATFLFVPEETTVLAMHPMYDFVKKGKGIVALKLCITGCLIAVLVGILASPVLIKIVPFAYEHFRPFIPFALVFVSALLILRSDSPFASLGIFLLAGLLGYFGLQHLKQPLLVLLTGFFGFPILLQIKKIKVKQTESSYQFSKGSLAKATAAGFFSSLILTFVPAVGPSQASMITSGLLKKTEEFLMSIGAIAGFDVIFSMIFLYSIGKARIGVLEILGSAFRIDFKLFIISLLVTLCATLLSYGLVLRLGLAFAKITDKINYRMLAAVVVVFVCCLSFYFDGLLGIAFLAAATGVGLLANKLRTNMSNCMGALVIPTLAYYFI